MKEYRLIFSSREPNVKDCVWAKPVEGGFALYMLQNSVMTPLKVIDDKDTSSIADNVVQDLVGSVEDTSTANTINGAKAYATSVGTELVGDPSDASSNMTLYGLKNYIDEKTS